MERCGLALAVRSYEIDGQASIGGEKESGQAFLFRDAMAGASISA